MNWETWKHENIADDGTAIGHPEWRPCGVWELIRSDGLKTAHHVESPFCSWQTTVEQSMRVADQKIPLGSELPDGMRRKSDPLYSDLWD